MVALGMSVVTSQATGVGITAVPTGYADLASDLFFVYEQFFGEFRVNSAVGTETYVGKNYDSKAMRKVPDGSDIAVTLENSSLSQGLTVLHAGRMLIKLH